MAVRTDIELWAENDKTLEVTVLDDAGDAVDLSTVTDITWTLRETIASTTYLVEKDLEPDPPPEPPSEPPAPGGITVTHDDAGIFEVTILPTDTVGLSGMYY
jgi:hypothetical protein